MSASPFALIGALPSLVVWTVAGIVAAVRWPRHPVVSALVITSAVLHCLASVAQVVVPVALMERGENMSLVGVVMGAVGLVGLVASGCLVAAAFVGRQDARTQ